MAGTQGAYVVLASEPLCLCGVDVAAPQQVRRQQQEPLQAFFKTFGRQFTPGEVRREQGRNASAAKPGASWVRESVATDIRIGLQWASISGAGATDADQEAAFRRLWSLKEVTICCEECLWLPWSV